MPTVIAEVAALAGAVFVLLAGVGVLRFPDIYSRMHATTKVTTLGIALIGTAAAIATGPGGAKAVAAVVFIFITAPSAAHFVGRAAYRAEGVRIRLDGPDELADLSDEDAAPPRDHGDSG